MEEQIVDLKKNKGGEDTIHILIPDTVDIRLAKGVKPAVKAEICIPHFRYRHILR